MNAARKVLVVYYSLTGNTTRVAKDLAVRLGADIESIEDKSRGTGAWGRFSAAIAALRKTAAKIGPLQHNPADYAIVVVGTPVWTGRMTPAVRAYLEQAGNRIQHVAFFVTSGDTDVKRILPSLETAAAQSAVAAAGFNATQLADRMVYQDKLSTFVERITLASQMDRRVA